MKKFSAPVITIILATIVAIAWFIYQTWSADARVVSNKEEIKHATDLIRQVEQLNYTMKAMESAVRAFVITGDTGFLYQEDYMEAQLRAPLENLLIMGRYDPLQVQRMDNLKTAVLKKMTFFRYVIRAAREAPVVAGAMIQTKNGATVTDDVERLSYLIMQTERHKVDTRLSTTWYKRVPLFVSLLIMLACSVAITSAILQLLKERRRMRSADLDLRVSESKYRRLVEGSGATIFTTNRGGFFTYVSSKVFDLTGYTPGELMNKQYTMLIDPVQHKELRAFYEKQAYEGPGETTHEFTIIHKNGERKWVEQQVVLLRQKGVFKGYQCMVKDIHHKKMMQQALEHTQNEVNILNERLHSILHNSPALIYIKDLHGRYLLVNKRFQEATGIREEQIIGRTDRDFPTILKPERNLETDREVALYELPVEMEETISTGVGSRYYYVTKFPLRDHTQRVYGICGIATDISDRIEHEHAMMHARKRAESAKRTQEIFMANMSHEIRTPLNGIIGSTNLLQQTDMQPEQKEFINDIKDSASNLLAMVDALLDFSRIRSGKLVLTQIDFDPRYLIHKIMHHFSAKAEEKGLQMTVEIDDGIRENLLGDPLRLKQVLENLVDNAIRFTEKGSVHLVVKIAKQDDMNTTLAFELRDTGIGIPEHLQHEIWEAFAQVQSDNERKHGGAGLGLTLARQLVKLQQGEMTIGNNEGGGTIILFSISFKRNLFSQEPEGLQASARHPVPPLSGKKILIAEDNLINQKVAKRTLVQGGAEADIASNGLEALQMLQQQSYDLILMDIQMPEMDGFRATRHIREAGSGIPIIAMTASALKGDREKCLLAGMNEYISKPFIPNQLYQKILETLGEREPAIATFNGADYEEQTVPAFIDLHYLRGIVDDDSDYMQDALCMFLERTSGIFDNLVNSAQQAAWKDVYRHASLLRSSLNVVRIFPLLDMIMMIEQQARLGEDTHNILPNVHIAIKIYNDAQEVLKKEIEQMEKQKH